MDLQAINTTVEMDYATGVTWLEIVNIEISLIEVCSVAFRVSILNIVLIFHTQYLTLYESEEILRVGQNYPLNET